MDIKGEFVVLGMKRGKGDYEGTPYDYTRIYVVMDTSQNSGNEKGMNVSVHKLGTNEEFGKYAHLQFPIKAELDLVVTTSGMEVRSMKPVASVQFQTVAGK